MHTEPLTARRWETAWAIFCIETQTVAEPNKQITNRFLNAELKYNSMHIRQK